MSAERRQEFERDIALFQEPGLLGPGLRSAIQDLGYNGTPLHSLLAGSIARSFPLTRESLARSQLIDVAAICSMLVVVCWAFGWRYGLLFALMVFSLPADRWALIGGSFCRYVWLATLVCGLAALHKERWELAGGLLTLSALLNVFPVLFLGGAGVALLGESYRARRLTLPLKRFALAAVASAALLGGISAAHGPRGGSYAAFTSKMNRHLGSRMNDHGASLERIPGFAVGLKMAFNYRGEHGLKRSPPPISHLARSRQLSEVRWLITGLGVGLLAWALILAFHLSALEAAVLVGFTGMFSVMTVLGYYFASASSIVLMLRKRSEEAGGAVLLLTLFAMNAFGIYFFARTLNSISLYSNVLTFLWLVFLLCTLAYYTRQLGLGDLLAHSLAAPMPRCAGDDADATTDAIQPVAAAEATTSGAQS